MLHGTGGNEQDLLPLGRALWPGAAMISPRGQVLERGMPRYFRRLAEGVFDLEDLAARTDQLGRFILAAARQYSFDPKRVVAVGFSNGANVAASLMLKHPTALAGAVLYRAMVPFEPSSPVTIPGTPVWLGAGKFDPIIPAANAERLGQLLSSAGARVTMDWRDAGHNLTADEVPDTARWLASRMGR
ncbi:MAG TPA: alpha/beta hydrolase [Gemmatimonadales bacterium]|nr:alpha/beta hydrolase [Gemmatimonadales bacterium]